MYQQQQPRTPLRNLFVFILCVMSGWFLGAPFGDRVLYPLVFYRFGEFSHGVNWLFGGLIVYYVTKKVWYFVFPDQPPQEPGTKDPKHGLTPLGRRLIGCLFRIPLYFGPIILLYQLMFNWVMQDRIVNLGGGQSSPYLLGQSIIFCALVLLWHEFGVDRAKTFIGQSTRGIRWYFRSKMGIGGSARIAGILEDWSHPIGKGKFIAGRSTWDPSRIVAMKDDRCLLSCCGARGGKGVSQIIPNLLHWEGSAIVIDPRGANAAVTASRRGKKNKFVRQTMNQDVYCINPFGVNSQYPWMPPSSNFNPLSTIKVSDDDYWEKLQNIGDALIIGEPGGRNAHFTDGARLLITGLIDYAIKNIEGAHLGHVRDALTASGGFPGDFDEVLKKMILAGGHAREAASALLRAKSAEEIIATASIQTAWLYSGGAVRECLSTSDFDLAQLKEMPTTVYVVLPTNSMRMHARLMRLFLNLVTFSASSGERPKVDSLLVIDEFFDLGPMDTIAHGAKDLAGYGVKLWPIVQNLGQLIQNYPQNWETFFANSAFQSMWSPGDNRTADYMADKLGMNFNGNVITQLRTPEEMRRDVGRLWQRLLVFREGDDALLLNRIEYYTDPQFRGLWAKDPDHLKKSEMQRYQQSASPAAE